MIKHRPNNLLMSLVNRTKLYPVGWLVSHLAAAPLKARNHISLYSTKLILPAYYPLPNGQTATLLVHDVFHHSHNTPHPSLQQKSFIGLQHMISGYKCLGPLVNHMPTAIAKFFWANVNPVCGHGSAGWNTSGRDLIPECFLSRFLQSIARRILIHTFNFTSTTSSELRCTIKQTAE